jgi:hypothetical protein
VELVEVDPLEPQALEAAVDGAPQVLRPPVGIPRVPRRPHEPALRPDHQAGRVRIQRLGDQRFVHLRPVAVGGV